VNLIARQTRIRPFALRAAMDRAQNSKHWAYRAKSRFGEHARLDANYLTGFALDARPEGL
jgi:hypothetical protein